MSSFELEMERSNSAKLKVIGCGGAGGNAVNRMIGAGLRGVEFIVANTDTQALAQSLAPTRLQIGAVTTRGLGSGGDPSTGRRSAEEDEAVLLVRRRYDPRAGWWCIPAGFMEAGETPEQSATRELQE